MHETPNDVARMLDNRIRVAPNTVVYADEENHKLVVEFAIPGAPTETIDGKLLPGSVHLTAPAKDIEYDSALAMARPVKPDIAEAIYENGLLRIEMRFKDPMEDAVKVAVKALSAEFKTKKIKAWSSDGARSAASPGRYHALMAIKAFRFALGSHTNPLSGLWRVSTHEDDVHVAVQTLRDEVTLTACPTGRWRIAVGSAVSRWTRPREFRPGWTRGPDLLIPYSAAVVRSPVDGPFETTEPVAWFSPPAPGYLVRLTRLFASPRAEGSRWRPRDAARTESITVLPLRTAGTLHLCRVDEPIASEDLTEVASPPNAAPLGRSPASSPSMRGGALRVARRRNAAIMKERSSTPSILTINGGSSSIRFAVYEAGATPRRRLDGKIDRIGVHGTTLLVNDPAGVPQPPHRLAAADHRTAMGVLLDWLEAQPVFSSVTAVGHRVVFGMKHSEPERVTPRLLSELHRVTPYDREHLRHEIRMIEAIQRRHPTLPQVACFDTAFHRTMPRVAKLLPIPRRYAARGVERYGFHGLSYAYLMDELGRLDAAAAKGRVILAHLGNGASLAAVHQGKSIDTSMGFTPASGLVMSTRTGDLDPGLVYYLARTERMTTAQFQQMVNHKSGLLGVSGTSSDMRVLLAREPRDVRAAEAVALFCYQAKQWIGAFAAALGRVDTLVFAGGIGENAPLIRERICHGLGFLGIALHPTRNARNAPVISRDGRRVMVRVIRTDEELMIARSVTRVLHLGSHRDT